LSGTGGEQEIEMWRNAYAQFPGFNRAKIDAFVKEGGHMPQFSNFDLRNPNDATGHPWWKRFDVTQDSIDESAVPGSTVSGFELAMVKTGGGYSTANRMRQWGAWLGGASKEEDQRTGASDFAFIRQNRGMEMEVFYEPHVLARTSTYAFNADLFGSIDQRKNYSHFDFEEMTRYASGGGFTGNEAMVKNGLSLLNDIVAMKFGSSAERNEAIAYLKSLGITEIRGVPVTKRFFYGSMSSETMALLGLNKTNPNADKNKIYAGSQSPPAW
jgi:hypothetical protein